MTHPLDQLDALDEFLFRIAAWGIETEDLRAAYWSVAEQVEAWRDMIQPGAIYPEPAPVENCPHPYDRDYAILHFDATKDGWYITRCCCVCGNVDPPGRISPQKKERKKKAKKEKST